MGNKMKPLKLFLIWALIFLIIVTVLPFHVTANQSPFAVATPDNQTVNAGDEAWFSANDSFDSDGNIVSYFWDFQDGTHSSDSYTTHIYNAPGDYTVILTVTDDQGATDSDSVNVTVLNSPQENTTVWIGYILTDKNEYNATEMINAFVMIQWDYGGTPSIWEGTLIFEVFNETMETVYYDQREIVLSEVNSAGISTFEFNLTWGGLYLARASLYDNASVFIELKEINITIIQNQLPVAIIDLKVQWANITETISFSGHLSYDPDGSVVSCLWEFGDGNSGYDTNVSHVYQSPGHYTISLTVWDNSDARATIFADLRVVDPENEPPVAQGEPRLQGVKVGDEVQFYSYLSYDPDGYIISYRWDLGDGNFTSGINVSHIYDSPGNYSVTLTITDNGYVESTDIIFVEVEKLDIVFSDDNQSPFGNSSLWNILVIVAAGVLSLLTISYTTEAGRYRFLGFLVPLYTKLKKEEILDHFTRGEIYGYIMANPGDHYNSIKKALKLSDGSFAHHIHVLEREGIVKSVRDGTHRRFYPRDMRILDNGGSLKKSQLLIIDKIRETPGISQKDIASLLGVSSATINYHLKELIGLGIIKAERAGMKMRYYFNSEIEDTEMKIIPKEKLKKPQDKKFIDLG
jgi:PKD repeat protein